MTIGDRISIIIREQGLKKVEFAAAVNIDQSYVTKIIKGTSVPSARLVADICKKFGVNRQWLETGEGEMFVRRNASIIEQLSTEFNLTEPDRELIDNFLSLPPDIRNLVSAAVSAAAKLYPKRSAPEVRETVKPDSEKTAEEAADVVRQERQDMLDAQKRATTTSPVSTGTSGTSKKFGKPIA